MNYITLINDFWKANIEYSFTGNESKLYFFLVHTSNSLGWKNPFRLSYRQIELGSGLTDKTTKSARNRLMQAGLISFKEGKKGSAKDINNKAIYQLRYGKIPNQKVDVPPNQDTDQYPNVPPNVPPKVNKQEETKQNESIIINNSLPRFSNDEIISLENLENEIYGYEILWIEQTAMRNKLNHEEIYNYLKEFFLKLRCEGEEMKSKRDFKKHFNNWVKAELKEKSKKKKSHAQVYHTNGKYEEF